MTSADRSRSRTACMARPARERTRFLARMAAIATSAHTSQKSPAWQRVVPPEHDQVVQVERADGEIGVPQADAAVAAGDAVPVVEHVPPEEQQPERHDHEVVAAQPQHERADQRADQESDDCGGREVELERPALRRPQVGRRVAADADEEGMAEAHLARVPGQKVQPQRPDGEDADRHERAQAGVAHQAEAGHRHPQEDQREEADAGPRTREQPEVVAVVEGQRPVGVPTAVAPPEAAEGAHHRAGPLGCRTGRRAGPAG